MKHDDNLHTLEHSALSDEKIVRLINWLEHEKELLQKETKTHLLVHVLSIKSKTVGNRVFYYGDFRVSKDSLSYLKRKYDPFIIRENKSFKINYQIGACVKCESATDFTLIFEERTDFDFTKLYKLESVPPIKIVNRQIRILQELLIVKEMQLKSILFGTYKPRTHTESVYNIDKKLNSSQKQAVLKALQTQDFQIILGPPGTGKTTIISELCKKFTARGERVLLTSWMNVAIDHALQAVLKDNIIDKNKVCRVGAGDYKIAESILPLTLPGNSLLRQDLDQKMIVGSTLASAYKTVAGSVDKFDVVIVDEAGAATVPQTLLALVIAKKFILIGDHCQLPPIVSDENCERWIRESLFEKLWKIYPEKHSMLNKQYRMNPEIAEIVSKTIYYNLGGMITPESVKKRPVPFIDTRSLRKPEEKKIVDMSIPVCWVDNSGKTQWINTGNGRSAKNDREVENVSRILELLVNEVKVDPKTIGVLSPFRYQVSTMINALNTFIEKGVAVNTIHSFQGNERDIIIVSMVAKHPTDSRIFEDIRLLNVAITRTKFKLIVVADTTIAAKGDKTSKIMGIINSVARASGGYLIKNALNPPLNTEIREDTRKDRTIANTEKFLERERKKLRLNKRY
ncbi:MAG: AAA domain-containing protein [Methanosarcina mazei]